MGDDPMHVMMRQITALFDEYQSKENVKHVLCAMNENARHGFWNSALPWIGYRIVAAEQRGAKTKKKPEIDPLHADTVRLIYRLFLECDGTRGAMGVKAIAPHLNECRHVTRDGGRGGLAQIHAFLVSRLIDLHLGNLGYSLEELADGLRTAPLEFARMHGFATAEVEAKLKPKPKLRLVVNGG